MGKSQPAPPPTPNYTAAAQAQGAANQQAAFATEVGSNPNIYGPYGSQTVSYSQGPGGTWQPTISQNLNPQAEAALNAQQNVQMNLANLGQQGIGQAQKILGTPFQYQGPGIQTGLNTSGVAPIPVNAGQTGYQAQMALMQPQIQQQQAALNQQLANQGIAPGTEAWNNAQRAQGINVNNLMLGAAQQGVGLDLSANAQGFNQALQSGQFGNTAAQQALSQQLGLYNQPLNEISALMSGSQIQAPQFQQYTGANVAAAPMYQAAQDTGTFAQNLYGQQMGAYNAGMQGLASLGGAAMGMFSFP